MLYAAIDIHKHALSGGGARSGRAARWSRSASRPIGESLARWAEEWRGPGRGGGDRGDDRLALGLARTRRRAASMCGWPSRCRPVRCSAGGRSAKTDRLDARWLARLLAKEMLPESWIPPRGDPAACAIEPGCARRWPRTAAAGRQRLHACLLHEGWPCSKSRRCSRRQGLALGRRAEAAASPALALQVDSLLAVMAALERAAGRGRLRAASLRPQPTQRCQALQSIYGIGPILACHPAGRDRRGQPLPTRTTRSRALAGLDPVVDESGDDTPPRPSRQGRLTTAFAGYSSRQQCTPTPNPP